MDRDPGREKAIPVYAEDINAIRCRTDTDGQRSQAAKLMLLPKGRFPSQKIKTFKIIYFFTRKIMFTLFLSIFPKR